MNPELAARSAILANEFSSQQDASSMRNVSPSQQNFDLVSPEDNQFRSIPRTNVMGASNSKSRHSALMNLDRSENNRNLEDMDMASKSPLDDQPLDQMASPI